MTIHGESSLLFDELCQLLQRAEHQIHNLPTATALNMVMMRPSMHHFVAHLSFLESDGVHQTELLEHRKVTVDRHKIDIRFGFGQTRMHLSYRNGESVLLKNSQNSLSGFR